MQLPDVEDAYYIVKWWQDCGTVGTTGQGLIPLTWQEIQAWRTENELVLNNFEISCIKNMSREYVSEYYAASDKSRPAPYSITEDKVDMVAVVNSGKNFLRGFREDKNSPRYTVEE